MFDSDSSTSPSSQPNKPKLFTRDADKVATLAYLGYKSWELFGDPGGSVTCVLEAPSKEALEDAAKYDKGEIVVEPKRFANMRKQVLVAIKKEQARAREVAMQDPDFRLAMQLDERAAQAREASKPTGWTLLRQREREQEAQHAAARQAALQRQLDAAQQWRRSETYSAPWPEDEKDDGGEGGA